VKLFKNKKKYFHKNKKILFFSHNFYKVNEIKNLFKKHSIDIISLKELSIEKEPLENGMNFIENARIKSEFGNNITGLPCFADDSGICIEALNFKPGVYSKRYIESFKTRNDCFKYIINKIMRTNLNGAYFNTSICLTTENKHNLIFQGRVEGNITNIPSKDNGFGYDPIFKPIGFMKTFAEMTLVEKNKVSHRSIAINKLINFLIN
tara:strand:- start:17692 stop:18312 length:621 start_codon:yes stop_codon:yes gene_type:complete